MLKIGTRNSPLALKQATMVKELLLVKHPKLSIELTPIVSEGDENKTAPLSSLGGKGVFIRRLEEAVMSNSVDCAVHSLKDVTTTLDASTQLASYLKPESRTDSFVFSNNQTYLSLADIPQGITCATSSLRRKAILKKLRPDIIVKDIRGNVETRINKCQQGYADATILSTAGLYRLNKQHLIGHNCNPLEFIPAPGQGVIAIQCMNKSPYLDIFQSISDSTQEQHSFYEQLLLQDVGLDCNYPLGVYTTINKGTVSMSVCWSNSNCDQYNTTKLQGDNNAILPKIHDLALHLKKSLNLA